jgi:hypothetical protein
MITIVSLFDSNGDHTSSKRFFVLVLKTGSEE